MIKQLGHGGNGEGGCDYHFCPLSCLLDGRPFTLLKSDHRCVRQFRPYCIQRAVALGLYSQGHLEIATQDAAQVKETDAGPGHFIP